MYDDWMDEINLDIDLSNTNISRKDKYKILKAILEFIEMRREKRKIKKI
ncbi:MAG: hypothetical protein Q4E69_01635 [Bacilli bacterium]|nr:hypothetical protein [Bacilli bacterium]